ncbi:MAG: hypothetical protein GKC04_02295 [Methanomicrobiales archaeon]|nr:hypothetical protein [Methanomicrobiales archaeon]
MQKEELLHLHMLLVHVRKYYEGITGEEISTDQYDMLAISPVHIHKNKICHKKAILTLGEELVSHIRHNRSPVVDYATESASEEIAVEH